jgi:release factor glutamine methyltransferase
LIPRPETEHVIEVALDRLALRELRAGRSQMLSGVALNIADIGTGSGCIAIALSKELSQAKFVATDISRPALEVAQRNAVRHQAADRIQLVESNVFDEVGRAIIATFLETQHAASQLARIADTKASSDRRHDAIQQLPITSHQPPLFDLIVSNPPYIGRREVPTLSCEVRDHEPEVALFGGEQGYELYADLVTQSTKHLKPNGILVLELGHDSLPAVQPLLDSANWIHVGVTNDLAGIPRVIAAERT